MRVCFFPPAYFNCILTLTAMRRLRWERVGWEKKYVESFLLQEERYVGIASSFYLQLFLLWQR